MAGLAPIKISKMPTRNDQWNQYRVLAVGPRVQVWINDRQVEDLTDESSSRCGFIGLQVHGVGDRGPFEVRWRNIKIKDFDPERSAQSQDVQFQPAPDVKTEAEKKQNRKQAKKPRAKRARKQVQKKDD